MSLNSQLYNNSGSTDDDSLFLTEAKKVEIKDIDPEYKEKLLRSLLNKLNEQNKSKTISIGENKE